MRQSSPGGSAIALLVIVAGILLIVGAIILPAVRLSHPPAPSQAEPDTKCLRGYLFERYADGKLRQIFAEGRSIACEEGQQ